MFSPLKAGTVLLQDDAFVPDSVWTHRETFCPGWQAVTNLNGEELDRQIRAQKWNFMFMAGALHGSSWGSWSEIGIRCAAIRVLQKSARTKFNAFEITGIRKRRFLRLQYVTVIGHSRHIQQSTVLQKIAERIHQAAQLPASASPAATLAAPAAAR